MRIYISSSASVDLSAGDDIPKELLEKVPVIFRTTAVEYDKRRFMGNLRATNDLEISYSSSGIVIIKRGELIPDAVLDKVPDSFKTSGVIPPAPSAETNAKNIAKNKIAIDTNKTDIADNNVKATKMTSTATSATTIGENGVEHWVTVASSVDGRRHGRVIVSDKFTGRHSFIEIDWMRSYGDSSFVVINKGGNTRVITGVRILRKQSDYVYGEYILQIRIDNLAIFTVSVISDYNNPGWGTFEAVTPIVEDTKVDFGAFRELTGIKYLGFGTSKGVKFGGDVYTDENFYSNGKLLGLDKAKCYVDMDPEDFPGDRHTYGVVGLSAIKYQTIDNHFDIDVNTNEIIIKKQGHYNLEVVLNHTKGSSTSDYSNARIFKNGNVALGGGSAGNQPGWYSLVIRALGENLVAGDRICVKANGQNDNSHWSTFSIEEI